MNDTVFGHLLSVPRDCPRLWAEDAASKLDVVDSRLDSGADRLANAWIKRAIDLVGACVGLVILAVVLLVVTPIIALETGCWPLFRQRRSGYRGAPFVIYKFRTMRVCEDGPVIEQATRNDDRITRFGYFMRRTSVDELPQLINVLKGEMSLVGPRPHAVAHDQYYSGVVDGYDDRFKTKPGLTGLAQVSGFRGQTDDRAMAARVAKDLEYIRDWSLFLDIKILLKTVMIFAFHPAAY